MAVHFRKLLLSVILLFHLECCHVRTICKQQKLLNGRNYRNMKNVQNFDEEHLGKYLLGVPIERLWMVLSWFSVKQGARIQTQAQCLNILSVQHGGCWYQCVVELLAVITTVKFPFSLKICALCFETENWQSFGRTKKPSHNLSHLFITLIVYYGVDCKIAKNKRMFQSISRRTGKEQLTGETAVR